MINDLIDFVMVKFTTAMVELVKIYLIICFAIIAFAAGKKKALPSKKSEGFTSLSNTKYNYVY